MIANKETQKIAFFEKHIGETPLDALQRFRQEQPKYSDSKLAYAGRLDPQARGQLLILIDEECKNRDHYQGLDKAYEFEILPGICSDTGDVMGRLSYNIKSDFNYDTKKLQPQIAGTIEKLIGKIELPYPAYSSKTVDGIPLWKIAKAGELDQIEIPTKEVEIYSLEYLGFRVVEVDVLVAEVIDRIKKVNGDFRQTEIIADWQALAKKLLYQDIFTLPLLKFGANVSSGTYVRTLGQKIYSPSLCFDINRTRVMLRC